MLYLGIDQHRKQLTVNLRDEQGTIILRRQVSTTWLKVRAFFAELRERAEAQGGLAAIVEVCGFNDWLLKMLAEYGCRHIVLAQAEHRSKKKTDRRDAHALSELLWTNRGRLASGERLANIRRVQPASPADGADRQLTVLRKRLAQLRTRTLNRIQHLLLQQIADGIGHVVCPRLSERRLTAAPLATPGQSEGACGPGLCWTFP